ncbi:MAG: lysophospholipid acyltransferase family protein [Calditrichaeota bacterium]|nr:lysophospholipid acyltransferase family protein [Calditrichota bacterium]
MSSTTSMQFKIEYALTKILGLLARGLSQRSAAILGDRLGGFFFRFIPIRRDVAFKNLQHALGNEKSDAELWDILERNYRHFGQMLLEFARISLLKPGRVSEQIPVKNQHILEQALAKGRGVLLLSGHFGNWEYLAAAAAQIGPPLYAVFKEQKNKKVDALIKEQRISLGLLPLKVKGGAARGILSALREGAKVLILFDQDAGGKGKFINFFGRPASTTDGPARIAIKYNVPAVFAYGVRNKKGQIVATFEPFPDSENFENSEQGITHFIETYNARLEKLIRRHPEQYFWMHRRWLTWERHQEKMKTLKNV